MLILTKNANIKVIFELIIRCIKIVSLIVVEGGDSCGISGTGETPQRAIANEEAHRPPHGKRPPGTEINIVRCFNMILLYYEIEIDSYTSFFILDSSIQT